jgi:hypothetical protein
MADVKGYHLVQQNPTITWDKAAGFNYTKEFEGETKAVRGLFGRYVRDGGASSIRFEPEGATAKLYVNYAKDVWGGSGVAETPVEVWELDGNDQEFSLWEHQKIKAVNMTTTANEEFRNEIKGQLEGTIQTDADGDAKEPAFLTASGPACPADLINLYRHLEKEQDSFQRPQPTLRHTFTFSQGYNYGATVIQRAFGNVNRIVTPAQLLSNATIGEPSLDAAMSTSLANIHTYSVPTGVSTSTGQQLIDGITHQWGWLKGAPRVISEGRRKVTVSQEWKLELWSTWAYSIAS